MEHWTDDLDHRPAKGGLDDQGPIRGKDAMRAHIRDWIDTFDEFWFEAVDLIDAGEETVVAVERFRGRAKLSGIEADQTCGVVFTIREGKIARCREYARRRVCRFHNVYRVADRAGPVEPEVEREPSSPRSISRRTVLTDTRASAAASVGVSSRGVV